MTTSSNIIIHRTSDTGRTLTAILLRSQSMRDGGHGCYVWTDAVDDGSPGSGKPGWAITPRREYLTVWQAVRAACNAGWHITID